MAISETMFDQQNTGPRALREFLGDGKTKFVIPEFQRKFSWSKGQTERLVSDIISCMVALDIQNQDNCNLLFIGSMIFCDERNPDIVEQLPAVSVIDGQQRLTMLEIIAMILYCDLWYEKNKFAEGLQRYLKEHDAEDSVKDEITKRWLQLSASLREVLSGQAAISLEKIFNQPISPSSGSLTRRYPAPTLIRAGEDCWSSDSRLKGGRFESDIASFAHAVCKNIYELFSNNDDDPDQVESRAISTIIRNAMREGRQGQDSKLLMASIAAINDDLKKFGSTGMAAEQQDSAADTGEDEDESSGNDTPLDLDRIQEIVREEARMGSTAGDDITKVGHFMKYIMDNGHAELAELAMPALRYYALSVYLLKYVSIVMIKLTGIKYAFDVFDALNTAGEPLTALESFRAQAFSRGPAALSDDAKNRLNDINDRMADMAAGNKQKYTKRIIETLSYVLEGRRGSMANNKLQREFIRRSHDSCPDKDGYIFTLFAVFRLYWDFDYANGTKSGDGGNLKMHKIDFEAPIAGFGHFPCRFRRIDQLCMQTLVSAGHRLALAPLVPVYDRYLRNHCRQDDFDEFTACLRTVTAFSTLFRLYVGGTARGIDKIYKDLMRRLHDNNESVTADLLRTELKSLLKKMHKDKPGEITDFLGTEPSGDEQSDGAASSRWQTRVASNDCYSKVKEFTRLALFLLQDNTIIGTGQAYPYPQEKMTLPTLKVPTRTNYRCSYHCERSQEYDYSIEHLVPQDEKYAHILDGEVHQLGNLLIMPLGLNQSMGTGDLEAKAGRIAAVQAGTDADHAAIPGLGSLVEIYDFYHHAPSEEMTDDLNDRHKRMITLHTREASACVYTLLRDLFDGCTFKDT